jgi:hypothetical protein
MVVRNPAQVAHQIRTKFEPTPDKVYARGSYRARNGFGDYPEGAEKLSCFLRNEKTRSQV